MRKGYGKGCFRAGAERTGMCERVLWRIYCGVDYVERLVKERILRKWFGAAV